VFRRKVWGNEYQRLPEWRPVAPEPQAKSPLPSVVVAAVPEAGDDEGGRRGWQVNKLPVTKQCSGARDVAGDAEGAARDACADSERACQCSAGKSEVTSISGCPSGDRGSRRSRRRTGRYHRGDDGTALRPEMVMRAPEREAWEVMFPGENGSEFVMLLETFKKRRAGHINGSHWRPTAVAPETERMTRELAHGAADLVEVTSISGCLTGALIHWQFAREETVTICGNRAAQFLRPEMGDDRTGKCIGNEGKLNSF